MSRCRLDMIWIQTIPTTQGVLYGKRLLENGPTGVLETEGEGGVITENSDCKDALISITLKPTASS